MGTKIKKGLTRSKMKNLSPHCLPVLRLKRLNWEPLGLPRHQEQTVHPFIQLADCPRLISKEKGLDCSRAFTRSLMHRIDSPKSSAFGVVNNLDMTSMAFDDLACDR